MAAPSGAPPSYETAIGSAPAGQSHQAPAQFPAGTGTTSQSQRPPREQYGDNLDVPHKTRNGIPPDRRRSMEDENRPLPEGWVRQYDSQEHHQFFVDTNADPPRSIWSHPYDDPTFMKSLPAAERTRIQGLHKIPTDADMMHESSDEEDHGAGKLPPREEPPVTGVHKLGRKLKDTVTSSTHQERAKERESRAQQEQRQYKAHQAIRAAMSKAAETGEPQLIGKDKEGKDIYIEPPYGPGSSGMQGSHGNAGSSRYGDGGYGVNPYSQGPYANPNARFIRPDAPYSRPYGYGYGGGYGLPLGVGLGGGLLGGSLLMGGMGMGMGGMGGGYGGGGFY